MQNDMKTRMQLVAKAARGIAKLLQDRRVGTLKKKNQLSSQENTETTEDGAFGVDHPEEDYQEGELSDGESGGVDDALENMTNPDESTNDFTEGMSESVDKEGEPSNGEEEGTYLDKNDTGFSFIPVGGHKITSDNPDVVTKTAIGQSKVQKNNKRRR